jgi:hypothetical protein
VSTLSTLIQHSLGIPIQSNKEGINKRNSNRKGRRQVIPICRWDDLIPKRPWKLYQKLLDIINIFSKVAGYKINFKNQ